MAQRIPSVVRFVSMIDFVKSDPAIFIALVAVLLNLVTLLIVLYQTLLTRSAVKAARVSADVDKKMRYLQGLTHSSHVTEVLVRMDDWVKGLEAVNHDLHEARKGDLAALKRVSDAGLKNPRGLIDRFMYESAPPWLAVIWLAAAQHYYGTMGAINYLWDETKGTTRFGADIDFAIDPLILGRVEDSIRHIRDLVDLIRETLPDAYLESPDRIREDRFFEFPERQSGA